MREKSIDVKWISNAIGFCHCSAHKGALNKELARKHKSLLKDANTLKSTMRMHGDKSLHIGTGGNKMINEMISLDKAIEFYKGYKERSGGTVDYNEFDEQLAEWLEELKYYRDKNKMVVRVNVENMDSIKYKIDELSKYAESQYNKAIDDFVNECICYEHLIFEQEHIEIMQAIAEQLKVGARNGIDN